MTRVGLHISLSQIPRIVTGVRLKLSEGDFSEVVAGARVVCIENVVPSIREDWLESMAHGQIDPTTCAVLEGDLVAWEGYFTNAANDDRRQELEQYRITDLFNRDLEIGRRVRALFQNPDVQQLGFSPFRYKVFFASPDGGHQQRRAFLGADQVVAARWSFRAIGSSLRDMIPADNMTGAIQPDPVRIRAIKAGVRKTKMFLEQLQL